MPAPIHTLKKAEILRLAGTRCEAHGHTYLEHYNCYLAEREEAEERVGFLDIESSNLDADFGIILSWCIKDSKTGEIFEGVLNLEDVLEAKPGQEDKRVVQELVDCISLFDKLVTFYGARFDIPFIRTRATACGVNFPVYGTLSHKDLWFVVRGKFKLSSNRLENACRVLLGKTTKNRIDAKYWRGGVRGDKESLEYILDHNRRDVIDLEKLYYKVIPFAYPKNSVL